LAELRRNVLRCARTFPPGHERNQHLQVAAAFARRSSVRNRCGITFGTSADDQDLGISQLAWAKRFIARWLIAVKAGSVRGPSLLARPITVIGRQRLVGLFFGQ
jgi:hypothetical protein